MRVFGQIVRMWRVTCLMTADFGLAQRLACTWTRSSVSSMSSVIAAGWRLQLARNRSTIAAIIRAISIFDASFSSRDMIGCEHSVFPLSGSRPTAVLNTGPSESYRSRRRPRIPLRSGTSAPLHLDKLMLGARGIAAIRQA